MERGGGMHALPGTVAQHSWSRLDVWSPGRRFPLVKCQDQTPVRLHVWIHLKFRAVVTREDNVVVVIVTAWARVEPNASNIPRRWKANNNIMSIGFPCMVPAVEFDYIECTRFP